MPTIPRHRSLSTLSAIVIGLLILDGLLQFGLIGQSLNRWANLPHPIDQVALAAAMEQPLWLDRLHFGLYGLTALFFMVWIICAHRNTATFGSDEHRITPLWAVLYFFIPIANLWMPYVAMKQLWHRSRPAHLPSEDDPAWLAAWWWCWLFAIYFGIGLIRYTRAMTTQPTMLPQLIIVDIFVSGLLIVVSILAMRVVMKITDAQKARQISISAQ